MPTKSKSNYTEFWGYACKIQSIKTWKQSRQKYLPTKQNIKCRILHGAFSHSAFCARLCRNYPWNDWWIFLHSPVFCRWNSIPLCHGRFRDKHGDSVPVRYKSFFHMKMLYMGYHSGIHALIFSWNYSIPISFLNRQISWLEASSADRISCLRASWEVKHHVDSREYPHHWRHSQYLRCLTCFSKEYMLFQRTFPVTGIYKFRWNQKQHRREMFWD